MKFQPMSEEDVASAGLLPPGEYDCEVIDAEDTTSKAGSDMMKLTLAVWDANGKKRTVWDYLVAGEKTAWKVRATCVGFGLLNVYNTGELSAGDFLGRTAKCRIVINESPGYPPSNSVKSYIEAKPRTQTQHSSAASPKFAPPKAPAMARHDDLDDDIPF